MAGEFSGDNLSIGSTNQNIGATTAMNMPGWNEPGNPYPSDAWTGFLDFMGWGSTARANEFAHNEAAIQRAFEMYMSNTAYQRKIADLKAAGINPVLASGIGSGASTPSTSAPSSSSAGVGKGTDLMRTWVSGIFHLLGDLLG